MHSLTDPTGNEITDPLNINHEYYREFLHRQMKRDNRPDLQDYGRIQNKLCYNRPRESEKVISPDFTFGEIKCAVQELKGGQCIDPTGLICEVFKKANSIKSYLIIGVKFGSKYSKRKRII